MLKIHNKEFLNLEYSKTTIKKIVKGELFRSFLLIIFLYAKFISF